MVASVPAVEHSDNECTRVCHFALDLLDALARFNRHNPGHQLNLRIGINEGPVVAGVVGTKRFVYDLWGDAVNLASRMESTGVPGRIQVTKAVGDVTKDPRFSLRFLERQEQLRSERQQKPATLRDHLRLSVADITRSVLGSSDLQDFRGLQDLPEDEDDEECV